MSRTVLASSSDIVDVDAVRVEVLVVSTEHNIKVLELKVALGLA